MQSQLARFLWTSLVLSALPIGAADAPPPAKAPFKVLFGNDTTNILSCTSPYHKAREGFTEEMLRRTVDEAVGADAHLLQPGLGWIPWWKSKSYPIEDHYRYYETKYHVKPDSFGRYLLAGGDIVKVFVDECRAKGVAPFVSLRMNDGHHLENAETGNAAAASAVSRFYEDHYKEWRIGPNQRTWDDHVLNWAIPEVREAKFTFVRELCEGYDLAGLELDFMRHPSFFKLDQTPLEQRRQIMTEFVARVRKELDRTAPPGKRRWLCVRVPAILDGIDRLGIDFPALAAAGVDMFNLSCSYYTVQQTNLPKIRALVPNAAIYLEMAHATYQGKALPVGYDSFPFLRTTEQQFYTTAALAYAQGADGVSLFNFVYYREHGTPGRGPFNEPPFEVLAKLADRDFVSRQPVWAFQAAAAMPKFMREHWPLPKVLKPKQSATFTLDLPVGRATGSSGVLRFRAEEPMKDCVWTASLNGTELKPAAFVAKPLDHPYDAYLGDAEQFACFEVPTGLPHAGANAIELSLKSGAVAKLVYFDLVVP